MLITHVTNKEVPATGAGGGVPQFVTWLAREQARHGHDVAVVAPTGRSTESFVCLTTGRRFDADAVVRSIPCDTDIVHLHGELPVIAQKLNALGVPHLSHIHGNHIGRTLGLKNRLYVSASHAANHGSSHYVYNGLPVDEYPCSAEKKDYMLFLGKVSRSKKGVDVAIRLAKETGVRLVVAGGRRLRSIETWLPISRNITATGTVSGRRKWELIVNAKALVFPVQWEEPFGLVLLEAMACGTPVVALDRGAVSEIVDNGVTGFVCSNVDQMRHSLERLDQISPFACRARVERHFSIARTYEGCLHYYRQVLASSNW